jgi:hypothetical protein
VGDGWHPYTISLRAVNWLHAASAFAAELRNDEGFRLRLFASLYGQAQVLFVSLELDVRGNHLMENIRALLWLGVAFEGAEPNRWFRRALTLLAHELAEQVLPDGGHFERSPSYHLVVLKDLLEIALWLRRNKPPVLDDLNRALLRMLEYLQTILPPTGRVPLLKDSAWDAAPSAEELLAAGAILLERPEFQRPTPPGLLTLVLFGRPSWERAQEWAAVATANPFRPPIATVLPDTGHCVLRDDARGDHLIFDVGKPCPDYLPAHAHADLLSYELAVDGHPIVVDSGVYEYSAGPWRDYFRSTRAHNTVAVEGQDQSQVWSSFRVAKRARPGRLFWKSEADSALAQCPHDGYRRLAVPVVHRRTLVWQQDEFWLIVDELLGIGSVAAASHVHLHPDLSLFEQNDCCWQIQGAASPVFVTAFGQERSEQFCGQAPPLPQGWYSDRFGHLVANTVLILHRAGVLPLRFGYAISKRHPSVFRIAECTDRFSLAVSREGREFRLTLPLDGAAKFESGE